MAHHTPEIGYPTPPENFTIEINTLWVHLTEPVGWNSEEDDHPNHPTTDWASETTKEV